MKATLLSLVLLGCSDTTAPTWPPSATLECEPEAERARLTWPTAVGDDVLVYVISVDGEERGRVTTGSHSYAVSELEDETSYTITVVALDDSENASMPITATITTLDGTPPEWPEGAELTATAAELTDEGSRPVDLAWPAAEDAVGYRILRDETQHASTDALSLSGAGSRSGAGAP